VHVSVSSATAADPFQCFSDNRVVVQVLARWMRKEAPTLRNHHSSGWPAFLRLWFVLQFSYLGMRLLFNIVFMGWIDLRRAFWLDVTVVPVGQAVVFWFVTRRTRAHATPADYGRLSDW